MPSMDGSVCLSHVLSRPTGKSSEQTSQLLQVTLVVQLTYMHWQLVMWWTVDRIDRDLIILGRNATLTPLGTASAQPGGRGSEAFIRLGPCGVAIQAG